MSDIGQALGNSLDRNGSGGMRADLQMGGNKIKNVAAGTDPTDVALVSQLTVAQVVPLGCVLDYWGATPPDGYLFAAGQAVSRITYADLFALIGTVAGVGDGSTTFNLPDYRAAVAAGKADMGGTLKTLLSDFAAATLGAIFGTQNHTLTTAQMPGHSHALTDPGHSHDYAAIQFGTPNFLDTGSGARSGTGTTQAASTGITIASAGGDAAHPNVQPTIVCNKIIRVRST